MQGLLEVPLNLIGIDPNYQFQLVLMFLTAVGYASGVAFLRVGPRSPWPTAIAGSLLLTYSNAITNASIHPQLLLIQLTPLLALLFVIAWRTRRAASSLVWGGAAGALLGLVLYSAFYVGWFWCLSLALGVGLVWLMRRVQGAPKVRVRSLIRGGVGIAVGFAVALAPFAATYLPLLREGRARSIDEVSTWLLSPGGLLNVGPTNALWGDWMPNDPFQFGEPRMAPTTMLLGAALAATVFAFTRFKRLSPWGLLGLANLVVGAFLWLIPLKAGGFQPWEYTLYLIPGGDVIRAAGRIELMAGMLLTLGVLFIFIEWLKTRRATSLLPVLTVGGLGLAVLLAEQLTTQTWESVQLATIRSDQEVVAPAICKSFVITKPAEPNQPIWMPQVSALMVSRGNNGLPTWNGYSGTTPDGWWLNDVNGPEYRKRVLQWGRRNSLFKGACGLDLATKTWMLPDQLLLWAKNRSLARSE